MDTRADRPCSHADHRPCRTPLFRTEDRPLPAGEHRFGGDVQDTEAEDHEGRPHKSAHRLWDVHREMEDWLHERVCSVFNLEEKILLLDITNTYFEGRMDNSEICQYGRSKEKRTDCKIVVLAAVVNPEGLIVRTMIYGGNRHDSTTIEEIVGSLAKDTSADARKIVVIDAGFYSKENVKWITDHGFDYIIQVSQAMFACENVKMWALRAYVKM